MTFVLYLYGAIKNVGYIKEGDKVALKSLRDVNHPYPSSYRTELDVTGELYENLTNRFHKIIEVLRCSI